MRSLRDGIEYRDDKRQKNVVETPFQFKDFAQNEIPPATKVKKATAQPGPPATEAIVSAEMHTADHGSHMLELERASQEAQRILAEAEKSASALLERTSSTAERLVAISQERAATVEKEARDAGYQKGYEAGMKSGQQDGVERYYEEMAEKYRGFFQGLEKALQSLETLKQEQLQSHLNEMKDLVITIARKVIHVSLETSGEVIKQMILSAAETGRDKQWSRVFISGADMTKMQEDGIDIEKLLRGFSDRIKIVINEDAKPGTCVVEFPDQIMDAGVETQLRNIQELIDDFADTEEPEVSLGLS